MKEIRSKIESEIRYQENNIKIAEAEMKRMKNEIQEEQTVILKSNASIQSLKWVLDELTKPKDNTKDN